MPTVLEGESHRATAGSSSTLKTSTSVSGERVDGALPRPNGATPGRLYFPAVRFRDVGLVSRRPDGSYEFTGKSNRLVVQIGRVTGTLNGASLPLAGKPVMVGGQLYVPARALEALGCQLQLAYVPFVDLFCDFRDIFGVQLQQW